MSEQKNNLSCAFKLEEITYHLYLMCKCCGYIISYCGCVCELVDVNRCKRIYSFGLSRLRGNGGEVERSRVELAGNRLIFNQLSSSTLLWYSLFLPLNSNRPLIYTRWSISNLKI